MMSHVSWGGEQTANYKGVETLPQQTRFKVLREARKGKPKEDNIYWRKAWVVTWSVSLPTSNVYFTTSYHPISDNCCHL